MQRTRTCYKGMLQKKKEQVKQGEHKVHIQLMAEAAEENWLDSWKSTTLQGEKDKVDMIGMYDEWSVG